MADAYPNFAALAAANVRGVDYEIASRPTTGPGQLIHIAIHGGAIESPTTQLAQYCAQAGAAFYTFSGVRAANNSELHITATHFDEPGALALVAASAYTVSWHGTAGASPVTYVGGADTYSAALVIAELEAAGFPCAVPPTDIAGVEPLNTANRNARRAGVQLEISLAQRQAFFLGGSLTSANVTQAARRTQTFYAYARAVMAAMVTAMTPPPGPGDPPAPSARLTARRAGVSVQLAVPFAMAADGSLAVCQDEGQAVSNRVRALVGTLPGERVMRADYGVPTTEALFAPDPEVAAAEVQLMVRDAVTTWEPTAVVTSVTPVIDMDLGLVTVDVGVGRADVPQAELPRFKTVTVAVGGSTTESAT
jgi:phage replication-related protein YjqB (UPF0714/DUF867 family)/phage baseplate assembly protein W